MWKNKLLRAENPKQQLTGIIGQLKFKMQSSTPSKCFTKLY